MATETRSTTRTPGKDPEKTVDLPPHGPRNPDPITDSPGSHPIETGIGAVIGGAASGAAVGAVGGPLGAIAGAIAGGAVAGGLAGKGVGELLDPTTEDNWIREYLDEQKKRSDYDASWEPMAREAYRMGLRSEQSYPGLAFDQCEPALRSEWEQRHPSLPWSNYRRAVKDGFERARAR